MAERTAIPTSRPPSLLMLGAVIVALAVFGFLGARYMVSMHSEKTLAQLGIVWPNIATLPDNERNFLVELALTCNVVARQPVRAEVVDCLRSAVPAGQTQVSAQLDRLIGASAPAGK